MSEEGVLPKLVDALISSAGKEEVSAEHIWYAIRGALEPQDLVNNVAEALRISAGETEELLKEHGFGDLVMQAKLASEKAEGGTARGATFQIAQHSLASPFPNLFSIETSPSIDDQIDIPEDKRDVFAELVQNVAKTMHGDAFAALYRDDIQGYYDQFMEQSALEIDQYIERHFGSDGPRYLVNSGIGANEQFNHYVAAIYNGEPHKRCKWLIMHSPSKLKNLPDDATLENTLFMEFSRSGKTEETVKVHEYTPRAALRIVFSNSGPLHNLGLRDNNLVLRLPEQVSGRFGRNKTPILLAPMHVLGMDTRSFWDDIQKAIDAFDLTEPDNVPFQLAQFVYLNQMAKGLNHIYLGCSSELLLMLGDEFTQFWNEGVNKDENDLMMSRYLGLPRDSHMNIEGILANYRTKMGIFLFNDHIDHENLHPLIQETIAPLDPAHKGLRYGEEEIILARANYERFAELMPSIKIVLHGKPSLQHAAVVSQLWADLTFCYSRLKGIDPGSNPEVKAVRDRAAKLLAKAAKKRQEGKS